MNAYRTRGKLPVEQQQFLLDLEDRVQLANSVEQYIELVSAGVYISTLEMQRYHEDTQKSSTVSFLKLDYNTVPDTALSISDQDLTAQYEKYKYNYKQDEALRSFVYVAFDVMPSSHYPPSPREAITELASRLSTSLHSSH